MTLGGVGHGRLIFPAIAPVSLLLAVGLASLPPRRLGIPLISVAASGLAILAIASPFVYIRPDYAIPRPVPPTAVPATSTPSVTFGESLKLIAATTTPDRVATGQPVQLHLYWEALTSHEPDVLVGVRLRDRDGAILYQKEHRPLQAHLPSDRWNANDIYDDGYQLDVPLAAYTGSSPIEVRVKVADGPALPGRVGGSVSGAEWIGVTQVAVKAGGDDSAASGPSHAVGAKLGDAIELTGFDLPRSEVSVGDNLSVVLYWSAGQSVAQNYTVFVHVADAAGKPVAQHDGEPADDGDPTSVWKLNNLVRDAHVVAIPSQTPPGRYRLQVGMYLHATGARLPIRRADGSTGDEIELGTVTIESRAVDK